MTYYCMHFENLLPIFIIKKLFAMHTRLIACFFVVCGFVQNNCFSSFPAEPGYILFKNSVDPEINWLQMKLYGSALFSMQQQNSKLNWLE